MTRRVTLNLNHQNHYHYHSHPDGEHEPSNGQTVHTVQGLGQVRLIGGLVVHDVDLHGVGLAIILVLGPLGVVGAPVEVELEHLVSLGQGAPTQSYTGTDVNCVLVVELLKFK